MDKAKVYYCDFTATGDCNLLQKLEKLIKTAGIETIDFKDKFTAIKIHFGEPGNLSYLRPNYARVLVDLIKRNGGSAFLTDCNTLYVGRRKNAIDHMDSAYENGFNPFATNCHVIIADGLKGTDDIDVPVNGEYVKDAKIGRAIMDADVFITLTHFKGHESTGFGGCLKNIGMGCGSRAGKMEMHYNGKPMVNQEMCVSCGQCYKNCAHGAISFVDRKATIDHAKCVGCGRCIGACNHDAIHPTDGSANDLLNKKIAEYSLAVVQNRPQFHISLVVDVSPCCDCHSENDLPIIGDVGMFASFDPVAIDQACADMCQKAPVIPGSQLAKKHEHHCVDHHDPFTNTHPDTNWEVCLEHAEKIGLGSRSYDLIEIK